MMLLFLARQSRAWSASVFAMMLWLAASGHAQTQAQLSGFVLDATGLPLAGATITLRGTATRVIQTDAQGQFDFQSLTEGGYELTAALDGFATCAKPLGSGLERNRSLPSGSHC
jgi:Carboxypeptidase regulatory-like domain